MLRRCALQAAHSFSKPNVRDPLAGALHGAVGPIPPPNSRPEAACPSQPQLLAVTGSTNEPLHRILQWIRYHQIVGFSVFYLFVEGSASDPAVVDVLRSLVGVKVRPALSQCGVLADRPALGARGRSRRHHVRPCSPGRRSRNSTHTGSKGGHVRRCFCRTTSSSGGTAAAARTTRTGCRSSSGSPATASSSSSRASTWKVRPARRRRPGAGTLVRDVCAAANSRRPLCSCDTPGARGRRGVDRAHRHGRAGAPRGQRELLHVRAARARAHRGAPPPTPRHRAAQSRRPTGVSDEHSRDRPTAPLQATVQRRVCRCRRTR